MNGRQPGPVDFLYNVGDVVQLRDDATAVGVITAVEAGSSEARYSVFLEGEARPFYESQLTPADAGIDGFSSMSLAVLRALLTSSQIMQPSTRTLHSLNAARIDFEPYQYQPVLKFMRSDQPRLLIADSVGVGKTIEAGLILRELEARQEVRRVMVLCTKMLVVEDKWRKEMKRFDQDFVHLDSKTLRFCMDETHLDGAWPTQYQRVIVPLSLLNNEVVRGSKGRRGLETLEEPPHFDLIILDEAHHIRNPSTLKHAGVRLLCENADAVLFLTATPIQLGLQDLFVLLNALRPDVFFDGESFSSIIEPNWYINAAAAHAREGSGGWSKAAADQLEGAAGTGWGRMMLQQDPEFQKIQDTLSLADEDDRQGRVNAVNDLERLHTLGRFMTRTLRRDIGEFTKRKSQTVSVEFSSEQRNLHDAFVDLHAEVYRQRHGERSVRFLLATIRRQISSCVSGLAPMIREMLARRFSEVEWSSLDWEEDVPDPVILQQILEETLLLAEKFDPDPLKDPKFLALQKVLFEKSGMANKRVMVFSTFRHTLAYLEQALRASNFRVAVIHGGVRDQERRTIRERFQSDASEPDALDILLFSEVGSEGLDYQFCDCIVNYDLPWNPSRIDQRIGRIDRRGQKSEAVAIYNLITEGTIDAEIYHRCLLRIGVFQGALGVNEVILGEISREIRDVAEDLSLSSKERQEKLEQIADNGIRRAREEDELARSQVELFGHHVTQDRFEDAVDTATSYWLSPESVMHLVSSYIQDISDTQISPIKATANGWTLQLSQNHRKKLYEGLPVRARDEGHLAASWRRWLNGDHSVLPIAFDSESAQERPEAVLLSVVHPLVTKAAASVMEGAVSRPFTSMMVDGSSLPAGDHFYCIYQWTYRGLANDSRIMAVAVNDDVSGQLLDLIPAAESIEASSAELDVKTWRSLEAAHHKKWKKARAVHQQDVAASAKFREASLRTSHEARIRVLDQQIDQAKSEKIKTMREGEKRGAQRDYERRLKKIQEAPDHADIRFLELAWGVLRVEN